MELQIQERKVQIIRTNVKPGAEVLRVAACCRVSTDSEEQLDSFLSHRCTTIWLASMLMKELSVPVS